MARLSAIAAAAAVAITTTTIAVAGVTAEAALPDVTSRPAAALGEAVRDTRLVVLSETCGAGCMARVKARLASRCDKVRELRNLRMLTARCAGASAASTTTAAEEMMADDPDVEDVLPDSVVTAFTPAVNAADGGRRVAAPATARQAGGRFWGLDRINQFALPLDGDVSTAACYPSAGAGVTVWVIDSGCTTSHPEFEGRATTE
eukprot:contig_27368_g6737